jgi:MFS family permease
MQWGNPRRLRCGTIRAVLSAVRDSRNLFGLTSFFFWASLYLYVPILAVHAQSLGASLSFVGAIIASYAIGQLLLRVPVGLWVDARRTRKPLVALGLLTVTGGALGLGLATTSWLLFFARTVTGVGGAFMVVFTVLYASFYPKEQSARSIGSINFINGAGLMAATATGGVVAQIWGDRATFFGGAILGLAGLVTLVFVKEPTVQRSRRPSWTSLRRVASNPLLLTVSFMALLVQFTTFAGVFGFVPVYAKSIGASSLDLGLVTMLALLSTMVMALAAAPLAQRLGHSTIVRYGAILMGLTFVAVPLIEWLPLLYLVQIASGAARGVLNTTFMALSIHLVEPEQRATAMGFYQAVYAIGMLLGPLVSGYLANGLGLPSVFFVSAGICVVLTGAASATALRRT